MAYEEIEEHMGPKGEEVRVYHTSKVKETAPEHLSEIEIRIKDGDFHKARLVVTHSIRDTLLDEAVNMIALATDTDRDIATAAVDFAIKAGPILESLKVTFGDKDDGLLYVPKEEDDEFDA